MNKKELRAQIKAAKRAMTMQQIESLSLDLCRQFLATEVYRNAKTVYGYLPYNQEVRTTEMLAQALADGKRVAVPKVYGDTMLFHYITDLSRIEKGYCGIPEPMGDEPVAREEDALVLMPGLAFDSKGGRMGYGGGFYDKFLSREPGHPTVALCYDFQVFPQLDTEEFDIPVDLVLWA